MAIRLSGMNSGLDTENIISELVKAKSVKKDKLVKAQTKLQWKQDAWKELNTKVYNLYSKTLGNMRLKSDYSKKSTKVSDSTAATVITGSNAVNGVQTLQVDKLATTGYLTGGKLEGTSAYKASDNIVDIKRTFKDENGNETGTVQAQASEIAITVGGNKTTNISIGADTTINDLVKQLKNAGVNANFDEKNQRFFISAKETGKDADFALTAKDEAGMKTLQALGLSASVEEDTATKEYYKTYCKQVNGTWQAKDSAELASIITSEVEKRRLAYENNKKAKATNAEKQAEAKFADFRNLSDKDLKTKREELEAVEKNESASADDKTEAKESLKAISELETLRKEATEIQTKIDADENNFEMNDDGVAVKKANSTIDADITRAVKDKAIFAKDCLNGTYENATGATRIAGQDAVITLNGAEFTSTSNNFEINGLTITANRETKENESITLTTSDDTDGIYDMVKNFLKEYNAVINEMDKLYNADSTKGYEPLTDEEKEAMSEKEIEKWEEKIKDSILRKDSTVNSVASAMKQIMSSGITIGGETLYLSSFGISTAGYFSSAENEKNAYHIDGDPDDITTSTKADKLKTAIANDPEKVTEFFSALTLKLYEKLGDMMKSTEYSSAFTLYDDKAMKTEYNEYKDKISAQEQKISDYEDRYYKKFTAMESALAKLSAKESAVSGLFS